MKNLLAVTTLCLGLTAAGCGSSGSSSSTSTPAPGTASTAQLTGGNVSVDVKGFAFTPKDLTVKQGTKVEWENYDSAVHNVVADNGAFKSKDLKKGDKFAFMASKPGTYSYVCQYHGNMKATLTVTG